MTVKHLKELKKYLNNARLYQRL